MDPSKLSVSDLTGLERVGVVNRNIGEKVCMVQILSWAQVLFCIVALYFSLVCEYVLFTAVLYLDDALVLFPDLFVKHCV